MKSTSLITAILTMAIPAAAGASALPFQIDMTGGQSITGVMDFQTSDFAYDCDGSYTGDPSGFCYGGEEWTDRDTQIEFSGGTFDMAIDGTVSQTFFSAYSGMADMTLSYNEDGDLSDCAWTAECESLLLSFEAYAPKLGETRQLTFSIFQRTAELFAEGFDPLRGFFDIRFDAAAASPLEAPVPAPAGFGLLGLGIVAAGILHQRRRRMIVKNA
ncbi:hypothetical protein [Pacificimonas flava]|uniref:PEP-CTERM protein-sorting domain-containing protein n=1 Tax=Pacificimonas flava TaxID=1234595 RepID=M2U1L1_9SPHN|nr:hypothetical protein [Pacificimonas flava]EMD81718.1 hypothetical protein C725_2921 [Pacificimonas flava]MBB5281721.1 hypothetical protein [Pacificimonas flava]